MKKTKKIKMGMNFTIFVLFFGLALIEAVQKGSWLEALLFIILGILFLIKGD